MEEREVNGFENDQNKRNRNVATYEHLLKVQVLISKEQTKHKRHGQS